MIRYGMVGGGPGALIGDIHRKAAALDGGMELIAGAFSSDPARSREHGKALGLNPGRVYSSFEQMAEREAALPREERIDFVSVVTPNHLHYDAARAFLDAGFHVVCDKPLTNTLRDAEDLCRRVARNDRLFALTHNYTGYPMVREARRLIHNERLGEIRKVVVEYAQGWLAEPLETTGHKQAEWRTDPARAGVGGALGDIGSHAEHLARYVTGLELESLCADVTTFVEGRQLDDDANLLLRYQGGAHGVLIASQVSVGEENGLRLRVYGTEAGLSWDQENPESLILSYPDRPTEVRRRGAPYNSGAARRASRLPPGHPEGFIEAFANLYRDFGQALSARRRDGSAAVVDHRFPTVQDGARGVHFIQQAVESGRTGAWVDGSYRPPAPWSETGAGGDEHDVASPKP